MANQVWKVLIFGMFFFVLSPMMIEAEEIVSIQELIDKAKPGDTIQLDDHVYQEDVVIDKPLILKGSDQTVIEGSGTGNVVTLKADGITIENVTITNSGTVLDHDYAGIQILSNYNKVIDSRIEKSLHGIYLNNSEGNEIIGNTIIGNISLNPSRRGNGIHLFYSNNNMIKENYIDHARDGIYFSFANHNVLEKNTFTHARYGIHYMYSDYNEFYRNDFYENTGGAAIMYSDYIVLKENKFYNHHGLQSFGILLQTANNVELENNQVHFNQKGIFLDQSNRNTFINNQITDNRIGLEIWNSSINNTFTGNYLLSNNLQYTTNGGKDANVWSDQGVGNAWSNHLFVDFDQDGISDGPYTYSSAFGEVLSDQQLGALFLDSPAITVYEKWNQLLKTDQGKIVDPSPIDVSSDTAGISPVYYFIVFILFIGSIWWVIQTRWKRV